MKYLILIALLQNVSAILAQEHFLGKSKTVNDSIKYHLEGMFLRTMNPRWDYFKTVDRYGKDSKEARLSESGMIRNDSILLTEVLEIYKEYGWPKLSQVDTIACVWAANQIVHADAETQRLFVPVFFKEMVNDELLGESWALLMDKLFTNSGMTQIYGTQYIGFTYPDGQRKTILWPVENYEAINTLRKELGMDSIEESMEFNGAVYDPKVTIEMLKTVR